jgi:hypothetical protein
LIAQFSVVMTATLSHGSQERRCQLKTRLLQAPKQLPQYRPFFFSLSAMDLRKARPQRH